MVLSDLWKRGLSEGEQLNFIALSGGATTAFNTATILQNSTAQQLAYIVTLGGVTFTNKPQNIGTWVRVVGTADYTAHSALSAMADQDVSLAGVTHTGYNTYAKDQTLDAIWNAGIR